MYQTECATIHILLQLINSRGLSALRHAFGLNSGLATRFVLRYGTAESVLLLARPIMARFLVRLRARPSSMSHQMQRCVCPVVEMGAYGYGRGMMKSGAVPSNHCTRGLLALPGTGVGRAGTGSAAGSAPPACRSSIEMASGVLVKAMRRPCGGGLIVTPWAMKALQVS